MDDWQQLDEESRRVSERTREKNPRGELERRTREKNQKTDKVRRLARDTEKELTERMFTFDSLGCSIDSRIEFAIYRSEFLHTANQMQANASQCKPNTSQVQAKCKPNASASQMQT